MAKVYVWDPKRHGLPKSADEAGAMVEHLRYKPDSPNPLFVEAAKQMLKMRPWQGAPDALNHPSDSLGWFENPMISVEFAAKRAMYEIGFKGAEHEELLPLAAYSATLAGLCAYVDEWQVCYLPGGKALPKSEEKGWVKWVKEVSNAKPAKAGGFKDTESALCALTTPLLGSAGFVVFEDEDTPPPPDAIRRSFRRTHGSAIHVVTYRLYRTSTTSFFKANLEVLITHEVACRLWLAAGGHKVGYSATIDFDDLLTEQQRNDLKVPGYSLGELNGNRENLLKIIPPIITHGILPFLEPIKTIIDIDRLLNSPDRNEGGRRIRDAFFLHLISAGLAHNPQYSEKLSRKLEHSKSNPELRCELIELDALIKAHHNQQP